MRFSWRHCLLFAGLTCVLAGCTTGKSGPGSGGSTSDKDTLRIVMSLEPTSLDPSKLPDLPTGELLAHCYEGLVRYNAQNEIESALAEKWDISADGKTYTFHLRNGVTFHNGRAFVADDVKYSWERALAPETRSNVAANYLDDIVGVADVVAGKRKDLPGVKVIDPHTLAVTLDRPRAYFLAKLSYPTGDIVCREAIEKNGGVLDQKALVGTGPFTLESYQPGKQILLKANPSYWGGKPKMEHLAFIIILNPETAYNNFETGAVDIFVGIPATHYQQDRDTGKFKEEYHVLPLADIDFLVMHPVQQPAFAKKLVRQAFAHAINRDEIVKVAFKNVGKVSDGMIPPELPGGAQSPPRIAYDPAKAKELLAQAGYPGGKGFPSVTLITNQNSPARQNACQLIRANLQDNLGITVQLEQRESGQYWEDAAKQTMAFYLTDWIADYPDTQDFLSTLFTTHASLNHIKYSNPQFDALCAQADMEPNKTKRAALYAKANHIFMEDVPVLPIISGPRIILVKKGVQGWRANVCSLLPNTETTKQ